MLKQEQQSNPFEVWDSLMAELKTVSPFNLEARTAIAHRIEQERAVLKHCGFDPATRTHCSDCY